VQHAGLFLAAPGELLRESVSRKVQRSGDHACIPDGDHEDMALRWMQSDHGTDDNECQRCKVERCAKHDTWLTERRPALKDLVATAGRVGSPRIGRASIFFHFIGRTPSPGGCSISDPQPNLYSIREIVDRSRWQP